MGDCDEDLKFLVDLSDHQSVVNAVRFSPCGRMIAWYQDTYDTNVTNLVIDLRDLSKIANLLGCN